MPPNDRRFLIFKRSDPVVAHISKHPVNRNGHIGEFQRFLPRKLSMDEIVDLSRRSARRDTTDQPRECEQVYEHEEFILVRYRLGSQSAWKDCEQIEKNPWATLTEDPGRTAVFGMIDRTTNRPLAMIAAHDDERDGGAKIIHISFSKDPRPSQDAMLAMLKELDVPACWRIGANSMLPREFDLWFDGDAGAWEAREPVHLVAMSMHRMCFATHPPLTENVDVFMLPDEEHPLEGGADAVYWAKSHYRDLAFERLHELPNGGETRSGFSSWMPDGDPRLVKVVDDYLAAEIERLEAERPSAPTP